MSTAHQLREKTPQELDELIADTRRMLLDLRFQNASGSGTPASSNMTRPGLTTA
ncbi:MAG: 50S ribosomal protein L29, partial [Solirubrobacterales bacterium]